MAADLGAQSAAPIVGVYLDTASVMLDLLEAPATARLWEQPSALKGMSVGGLAGHLARSVLLTEPVLDAPGRRGTPLSTAEYYLAGGDLTDFESRANRRVRETGEETAAEGVGALVAAVRESLERLRTRLPTANLDEAHVWFDRLTTLRTVLEARVIEMVIHMDDLAASTNARPPVPPPEAFEVTIAVLIEIARRRHSDVAVVRALARRERDTIDALRVL